MNLVVKINDLEIQNFDDNVKCKQIKNSLDVELHERTPSVYHINLGLS